VGERITKSESLLRCESGNPFIFSIDEEHDLDGSVAENLARFINHSCAPNCDAEDHEGRIWVVARRDIAVGEELTYNYNFDLEDYPDNPCHCGAPACLGYMVAEELFGVVRERLRVAALAKSMVGEAGTSSAGGVVPSRSAADTTRLGAAAVPPG
jgi:hypothetical protein